MKKLIILLLLCSSCYAINWEIISRPQSFSDFITPLCFRSLVPHGWLILCKVHLGHSITFYPDEKHEWKL